MGILDTKPEPRFDEITAKASRVFNVPISTVSIIDKDREWFKSCWGLPQKAGERDVSFCGHALLSQVVMVVEDATKDARFADNPYVVGPPYIRFYAGVALKENKTHMPVGVLCIKDTIARKFSPDDVNTLMELGKKAEEELNNSI